MKLTKAEKEDLFQAFGVRKSAQDTGSVESQAALFTHRIKHLTQHLGTHKKDKASRLGLTKLVGKRKCLLTYLKREDLERYRVVVAALGLRK
jgi:small subunit ribosomal protein S15